MREAVARVEAGKSLMALMEVKACEGHMEWVALSSAAPFREHRSKSLLGKAALSWQVKGLLVTQAALPLSL